jgi:hypothetical protein
MCQLTSGRVAHSGSESDGQQDGDGRLLEDERRQRQVGDVRCHVDGGDAAGSRRRLVAEENKSLSLSRVS